MTHCPGDPNFKSRGQALAACIFVAGLLCLYIAFCVFMTNHPPAFPTRFG